MIGVHGNVSQILELGLIDGCPQQKPLTYGRGWVLVIFNVTLLLLLLLFECSGCNQGCSVMWGMPWLLYSLYCPSVRSESPFHFLIRRQTIFFSQPLYVNCASSNVKFSVNHQPRICCCCCWQWQWRWRWWFETGSHLSRLLLSWRALWTPGPLASASSVLRFYSCTTAPSLWYSEAQT